ncbi:hypothetical protein QUF79_00065 [Fictibacillus enclensis]|uniref:hypothetical protein n=1 Tax=Fictibacillus enclensis TaxID=1017270 RepID=UPI0025A17694|nr:hypothetical protein [Fictibacillus enclensis]MDM5196495.1 hypothetical protein [Fictibacillus enclensis]
MKKHLLLGFIAIFLILAACGKDSTLTDINYDELKNFISDKETGFIYLGFDRDNLDRDKKQVSKALEKNDSKSRFFNYRKEVSNKQSQTFKKDMGTEQSRDSLGYYDEGVLMAEFKMPNNWTAEKMEDLNKFISQISE